MCLFLSFSLSLPLSLSPRTYFFKSEFLSLPRQHGPCAVLALAREPSLVRPRSPATPDGSYLNRSS
jgi:hypothetical protein